MHEYGLALDIAHRVEAEVERAGGQRIAALDVEVGGLARLDPEALAFWLREALAEVAAPVRIRVLKAPLTVTCVLCSHRRAVVPCDPGPPTLDAAFRCCPQCGSEEVKLDGKAGCRIRTLRFEA